jgi:hypothetical protein
MAAMSTLLPGSHAARCCAAVELTQINHAAVLHCTYLMRASAGLLLRRDETRQIAIPAIPTPAL